MKRIALLIPRLDPYDAVARDVLGMRDVFIQSGVIAQVFSQGGKLRSSFRNIAEIKEYNDSNTTLIYHYAIAWKEGDLIYDSWKGRRIIKFHNVTPPEFFEPYHKGIAEACRVGRNQLKNLESPDLLLADSEFNHAEYLSLSKKDPPARIIAPFHRIERLKSERRNAFSLIRMIQDPDLRLLQVGRLVPNKRPEMTLKLAESIVQSGIRKTVHVIFAGSIFKAISDYNRYIFDLVKKLPDTVRVSFLQSVTESELSVLYRTADYVSIPSVHEGFCVPALEAIALGVNVLAGNHTGYTEILPDSYLSKSDFILDSMNRLAEDFENQEKALEQIENGYRIYSNFRVEKLAACLKESLLYDSSIENKKRIPINLLP